MMSLPMTPLMGMPKCAEKEVDRKRVDGQSADFETRKLNRNVAHALSFCLPAEPVLTSFPCFEPERRGALGIDYRVRRAVSKMNQSGSELLTRACTRTRLLISSNLIACAEDPRRTCGPMRLGLTLLGSTLRGAY
jgi:hypothetical protein